jgi:ABC-type glycerol-3-phosphate transport system substrate-binding protein
MIKLSVTLKIKSYWRRDTMKKLILILLVMMLSLSMLAGCGDSSAPEKPAATPEPTSTTDSNAAVDLKLIKELEQKNIELVEVYNELAELAVKNGWDEDELTVKELGAADVVITTFNSIIEDPSSAEGADMSELLSATDELIKELDTNIRKRVSAPFASK